MVDAYAQTIERQGGAMPKACPWRDCEDPFVQDVIRAAASRSTYTAKNTSERVLEGIGVYKAALTRCNFERGRLDDEARKARGNG